MTVTEERLRESLGALADSVAPAPGAYARAHRERRRRDRRRRLLAFGVAVVLVTGADAVGLWALTRDAPTAPGMVFDGPAPVQLPDVGPPSAPTGGR